MSITITSSPEETAVSVLCCGEKSLSAETEVEIRARRRIGEVERTTAEEFPELRQTLLVRGPVTQRDERCRSYSEDVGFVDFADRHAADHQRQTEHRLVR